jgi:magnesium chelatase subunit I
MLLKSGIRANVVAMSAIAPSIPVSLPTTLGALRETGYTHRTVKAEIRSNLTAHLAAGEDPFPGILGFEDTVRPQLERALLAGHDIVLLGERGQGKTRLIRTLVHLLDEWMPVVDGCEINDDPTAPVCARCRRLAAETGDALPITWRHRSERYGEKLATPDTSVGDLVGDVDPVKVAQGRTLGDPETIHFGLVPRTNRGIFAINELPDLAERIQVALLNVLEERDIQVRGYTLRLPLDLLMIASANPEDYTNRGRIITPLKDRFGAEIRTHYPLLVADEVALLRQEAAMPAVVPQHLLEVVARFTRQVRESSAVDQRSGVSARFAVACAESLSGAALRRAAISGEPDAVARIGDLAGIVPTLRGKVEFDVSEEGREEEILQTLARRAAAETFRLRIGGSEMTDVVNALAAWFDEGNAIETGDTVTASDVLASMDGVEGLGRLVTALEGGAGESPGVAAACLEFALEGLWLTRRIDKDEAGGLTRYGIAPV